MPRKDAKKKMVNKEKVVVFKKFNDYYYNI